MVRRSESLLMMVAVAVVLLLLPVPVVATTYGDNYQEDCNNGKCIRQIGIPTYHDGIQWQPSDLTPLLQPDGNYAVSKSKLKARFNGDKNKQATVTITYNDNEISFIPDSIYLDSKPHQTIKSKPVDIVTNGNTVTYGSVFGDGFDVQYTMLNDKVKEVLVLPYNPYPTATDSDYLVFESILYSGSKDIKLKNGNWNKKTKSKSDTAVINDLLFTKPYAYDNTGKALNLEYTFTAVGETTYVSVAVPMSYLKNAVYPVVVDPTATLSTTNFAYIDSGHPNESYAGSSAIGMGDDMSVPWGELREFVTFDLSAFNSNYTITNATLKLNVQRAIATTPAVNVHEVTSSWTAGSVTWNTAPTVGTLVNTVNLGSTGWKNINVTSSVQSVVNGSRTNYGWRFADPTVVAGSNDYAIISSHQLEITYSVVPTPLTPANNNTTYYTYPPLTTNVNLSWTSSPGANYHMLVSTDTNFSVLTVNRTVAVNYSVEPLQQGTYYWKVRTWDGASEYGTYSNVSNFTLIRNTTGSGSTAIQGIVYEKVNGVDTPISSAQVFIYNSTWTNTMFTGSNGYYEFTGLANSSVYSLQAKKQDYDNSNTELVNTTAGAWVTKDIYMEKCTSSFNCFYNKWYVTFTVRNRTGAKFIGVSVTAYKDGELTADTIDTTGSDGKAVLLLNKAQRYRITATNTSQNISDTVYITPGEQSYTIWISQPAISFTPTTPGTNFTNYTVNYTASNFSIQNLTTGYLNSTLGIGTLGQGILSGTVNWIIVGGAGGFGAIISSAILAYLGVLSWATMLIMTATLISLWYLGRDIG